MNLKCCFKNLFNFRKSFAVFLVVTLVISIASFIVRPLETKAVSNVVAVYIDKKKVKIKTKYSAKKVGPVVIVPAKQLAKALKAKYSFLKESNKVVIKKTNKKVILKINSKKIKIGKKTFNLRRPVTLTKGMPMVDAVNIAKKIGFKYSKYVTKRNALYIASKKSNLPVQKKNTGKDDPIATPTFNPTPTPKPTFSIDPNAGADTYRKTGLPIVFINTDDGKNPKDKSVYQSGIMCIEQTGAGGVKLLEDTEISIAVRGNSTAGASKKPYKFRFVDNADGTANKKEVLGMTAHHKWNLLANAYDKSLLRNAVALKFASQLSGLDFTPDFKFVDVVLNGDYIGNYMLTERVEIANERVNIKKKNNEGDKFGYIVEWDQRSAQEWTKLTEDWDYFKANVPGENQVAFAYKDPDSDDFLSADGTKRRTYIKEDVINTWNKIAVASNFNTEFLDYIDIDSFIDFYMVQELMMPVDGYNFSSIYFYKDSTEDAKMHAGPAWDYDLALGNTNPDSIGNLFYLWAAYCAPLRNHYETKQKYVTRWKNDVKPIAEAMIQYIDETSAQIKASAELNYQRWSISSDDQYSGAPTFTSYDAAVNSLKTLYNTRYNAMNNLFNSGW